MRPNAVIVVLAAAAVSACDAAAGTPRERLTTAEAERLPGIGQLWSLCPVPDVSDEFRERVSRTARLRARALIEEVPTASSPSNPPVNSPAARYTIDIGKLPAGERGRHLPPLRRSRPR